MNVTGLGPCVRDFLAVVDTYPEVDSKKEIGCRAEQGGGSAKNNGPSFLRRRSPPPGGRGEDAHNHLIFLDHPHPGPPVKGEGNH